jgi:hypothetical protein
LYFLHLFIYFHQVRKIGIIIDSVTFSHLSTRPSELQNTVCTANCMYGHDMVYMLHPLTKCLRTAHDHDSTYFNFKKATIEFESDFKASAHDFIDFRYIFKLFIQCGCYVSYTRATIGTILPIVSK